MNPFLIKEPLFYYGGVLIFILLFVKGYFHYRLLSKSVKYTRLFDKAAAFRQCIGVQIIPNPDKIPDITLINRLVISSWTLLALVVYFAYQGTKIEVF
jgi:hypothetical protein